jgi:hypothetical protein
MAAAAGATMMAGRIRCTRIYETPAADQGMQVLVGPASTMAPANQSGAMPSPFDASFNALSEDTCGGYVRMNQARLLTLSRRLGGAVAPVVKRRHWRMAAAIRQPPTTPTASQSVICASKNRCSPAQGSGPLAIAYGILLAKPRGLTGGHAAFPDYRA